jgi:hypothetical protein
VNRESWVAPWKTLELCGFPIQCFCVKDGSFACSSFSDGSFWLNALGFSGSFFFTANSELFRLIAMSSTFCLVHFGVSDSLDAFEASYFTASI